jgi:hypothetical protein
VGLSSPAEGVLRGAAACRSCVCEDNKTEGGCCRQDRRTAGAPETVCAAGLRGPAEEDFELGKDCFGLDQSQVRLYAAIARHTVLVRAAMAICAVTAALLRRRTDTQAPAPVLPDQPPPAEFGSAAHWLDWRRHQARSRWYHKRTRLARATQIALVS